MTFWVTSHNLFGQRLWNISSISGQPVTVTLDAWTAIQNNLYSSSVENYISFCPIGIPVKCIQFRGWQMILVLWIDLGATSYGPWTNVYPLATDSGWEEKQKIITITSCWLNGDTWCHQRRRHVAGFLSGRWIIKRHCIGQYSKNVTYSI